MTYTKQTWVNGVSGGTPISADRLTHIENGIFNALTSVLTSSGRPRFDARSFAVGDTHKSVFGNGLSKPLSTYYSTLPAAQVDYPLASSLTNELDWIIAQTAINAAMTNTDPTTTARIGLGRLFFDAGTFIVNRPLSILSVNGFFMSGTGWATEFRCADGITMENVFDLDGVCFSVIQNFRVNGPLTTGQVTCVFDYYWDTTKAFRSSSGCSFSNIWIGGNLGRFVYGFGISRLSNGARQVDNTEFRSITVSGGDNNHATLWKRAYTLGSGSQGNQTNYYFYNIGFVLCDVGVYLGTVKSIVFIGGSISTCNTIIYVNGAFDWTVKNWEIEVAGRLLDGIGASSAASAVQISNIQISNSGGMPSDGEFMRYYMPGVFIIEGVRIATAATDPTYHFRFNTVAGAELSVLIDGLQVPDPITSAFSAGMISGPTRAIIRAYTETNRTSGLVTSQIIGPMHLTATTTDIGLRTRIVGNSQDSLQVSAAGVVSWGAGTGAVDTNLYRVSADTLGTDDDFLAVTIGKGVVIKSPDGTKYRITVANGGALSTTAI